MIGLDDFVGSSGEELYDALKHCEGKYIETTEKYNSAKHKAIRMMNDDSFYKLTLRSYGMDIPLMARLFVQRKLLLHDR